MRKRNKWLVGVVLVITAIAATIFFGIKGFAASEAHRFLAERGVPVNQLTVASITTDKIILQDVSLGHDENFKAKSMTITRLSGTSLDQIKLRIEASGIGVHGVHNGKAWLLGGVENLWQEPAKPSDNKNMASITLTNGSINVEGSKNADITGVLRIASLNYQAKGLRALASTIEITPHVSERVTLLNIPFTIAQININNDEGALLAPLSAAGSMRHKLGSDLLTGTLKARDLNKILRIKGDITHSISKQQGKILLTSNKVNLGEAQKGQISFATLLPVIAASTPTPEMQLQMSSVLLYTPDGLQNMDGVLNVDNAQAGSLLKAALSKYGELSGRLKANIPFALTPDSWKINNGHIENIGPMKLALAGQKKQKKLENIANSIAGFLGKDIPAGALDAVNISTLKLALNSINNSGDVLLKGALNGHNPLLNRGVKININLTSNLNDMMRSLAASKLGVRP
jgi:hypothetical protein